MLSKLLTIGIRFLIIAWLTSSFLRYFLHGQQTGADVEVCPATDNINTRGGYKILIGKTGTGKSYISTQLGCRRDSCDGHSSCSTDTSICFNGNFYVIDSVGLDDDKYHSVEYNGNKIDLTGSTFTLFDLFSTLERSHISQVEFYHVYDANSIRDGNSIKLFLQFLESTLKCQSRRVLNKYRDIPAHENQRRCSDLIVKEGQINGIEMNGAKTCEINLPSNWREALIKQDLHAFKQIVDVAHCQGLKTQKCFLEGEVFQTPSSQDTRDCSYRNVRQGGCRRKRWGRCTDHHMIHETLQNPDCEQKRHNANVEINQRNARIQESREANIKALDQINSQFLECKTRLANHDLSCSVEKLELANHQKIVEVLPTDTFSF